VLLAHPDPEWVARARQRLEGLGYLVTDCLDLDLVADLATGAPPFQLVAVSSELGPDAQLRIMKHLADGRVPTKLLILLDSLDSESIKVRGRTSLATHRVSADVDAFALVVAGQIGAAPRPPI
jgi:hypothetical protein